MGASRVYVWTDEQGKKLKCSAPLYFDYAMCYVQDLLGDEDVFPTKSGPPGSPFTPHCLLLRSTPIPGP